MMERVFQSIKEQSHKVWLVVSVFIVCVAVTFLMFMPSQNPVEEAPAKEETQKLFTKNKDDDAEVGGEMTKAASCIVDVKGAVKNEGVYTLQCELRIQDAIVAAGGVTPEAELSAVNLARRLEDGALIFIPLKGNTNPENANRSEEHSATPLTRVNINEADQQMLETLPGIGPTKAMNIINYREQHGLFTTIEQIKEVDGIGEGTYQKLKDQITLS
ncbi:MAG: helix-hairpin-helix domain-containing protein [Bacilli bacterium]